MLQALVGAKIFDGDSFIDNHAVLIDKRCVEGVVPIAECPAKAKQISLDGGLLAPGLIDLQVNGGGGALFSNAPTMQSLKAIVHAHRAYGTTTILPTLISGTKEVQEQGVGAIELAFRQGLDGVLGIHIEGPNFNPVRRGVHKSEYLKAMEDVDIQRLQLQREKIKSASIEGRASTPNTASTHAPNSASMVVTLAPECCTPEQINLLAKSGIHICAGHSDANHEQIFSAIAQGLRGFTHLFNAMRPMQARDPGVVGAALVDSATWCGIIADGHHVHPVTLGVALKAKVRGKIFLVSDAMATLGGIEKTFQLYGEDIREIHRKLVNSEGRLAGSAIALLDGVRFCVDHVGVSLKEALRMASLYPAEFLGVGQWLGRIAANYRADIVHLSADYRVLNTWVAGEHQSHTASALFKE